MQTKLTLRMDDRVIAEAKAWARAHDVSLSEVVARYLARLSEEPPAPLSPWTRRLIGAARKDDGEPPTDAEIHADYIAYLDAKHR